jgi:effector-binding domain-containing protein
MLKIGDFSKISRVSIKTLRYYDEIGLLKPAEVDKFTGYRYYSVDQLSRLNRIMRLKELGLSLEEIGQLLADNPSAEKVIKLLRAKREAAIARLYEEETRLRKVEEWLKRVEKEGTMPDYDIVVKKLEAVQVASVRDIVPSYGEVSRLFNELFSYLARHRVQFVGPPLIIYHDAEYMETDADIEVAVPINGTIPTTERIKMQVLPEIERAACLIHKGPYENLHLAYAVLMTWVEANGYQITWPNREVYLKGPGAENKDDPATYVTEIQLPVKKGKGEKDDQD